MKNKIQIKTYNIDYSFIVKNYLDKNLWHKEWTLFVYKNFTFTLTLNRIDIYDETIAFSINGKYVKNNENCRYSTSIWHNIGNCNINVLKKQINGAIESLIADIEESFIRSTEEYNSAEELENIENEKLRDYAEEFLDSEGVSNKEIRDAYIDYYVDKNSDYDYTRQILNAYKYLKLFDLYMTFYQIKEDEAGIKILEQKYIDNYGEEKLKEIQEEIKENLKYIETEEYEQEKKDCLENI